MFGYDLYDGVGADYTRGWVYAPSNFALDPSIGLKTILQLLATTTLTP
jgi:hypothetical protein